jgi:hypothetical protein
MSKFHSAIGACIWALMVAAVPALAAGSAEPGAPIPHSLDVVDQSGGMRNLETLAPNKGVVLLFTRSLHW